MCKNAIDDRRARTEAPRGGGKAEAISAAVLDADVVEHSGWKVANDDDAAAAGVADNRVEHNHLGAGGIVGDARDAHAGDDAVLDAQPRRRLEVDTSVPPWPLIDRPRSTTMSLAPALIVTPAPEETLIPA